MRLDGLKMISVIEGMSRWQKQQGNSPAVLHCGGGVGRAAAFIAIANCLEQVQDHVSNLSILHTTNLFENGCDD